MRNYQAGPVGKPVKVNWLMGNSEINPLRQTDLNVPSNNQIAHQREFVQPPVDNIELDPNNDPILELIGIADVEPLSRDIDELLYGFIRDDGK